MEREISNNRGGDVLEVDLAETQINDDIANSLSKMPKLSKIDLSQTVKHAFISRLIFLLTEHKRRYTESSFMWKVQRPNNGTVLV